MVPLWCGPPDIRRHFRPGRTAPWPGRGCPRRRGPWPAGSGRAGTPWRSPSSGTPSESAAVEDQPQVLLLQVDGEARAPVVGVRPAGRGWLSIHDPAAPPSTAAIVLSRSSPPASASSSASDTASMFTTTRTWLTSLQVWPAPTGPTWVIVRPIASRTGRARSTSASDPPTMIDRVPFFGALARRRRPARRRSATPWAASRWPRSRGSPPARSCWRPRRGCPRGSRRRRPRRRRARPRRPGCRSRRPGRRRCSAASSPGVAATAAPAATNGSARPPYGCRRSGSWPLAAGCRPCPSP